MNTRQIWFRSTKFAIEPGEDEETNPFCFGRQLSHWMREQLISRGRTVEEVIPEDFGWCVMVSRNPFPLWVGCVSVRDTESFRGYAHLPKGLEVAWTCSVFAERSFIGRIFGKVDMAPAADALFRDVCAIVESEPSNVIIEER